MLLIAAASAVSPVPTITAQDALTNAQRFYSVTPPKPEPCPEAKGNEIVVCAKHDNPKEQYVPSDLDNGDPDDGIPRAPAVTMLPNGGTVTIKGCFIPPCPPPAALLIDVKATPKAPAGSDADRISKGEAPAP